MCICEFQNYWYIAKKFYDEGNDYVTKVTDHFVKSFIKRDKLDYIKLHGEAASAEISQIDSFIDVFNSKRKQFKWKTFSTLMKQGCTPKKIRINLMFTINPRIIKT